MSSTDPVQGSAASRPTVTLTVADLGRLLCSVQGNDHYDTDYAPCSSCREIAEDIARED